MTAVTYSRRRSCDRARATAAPCSTSTSARMTTRVRRRLTASPLALALAANAAAVATRASVIAGDSSASLAGGLPRPCVLRTPLAYANSETASMRPSAGAKKTASTVTSDATLYVTIILRHIRSTARRATSSEPGAAAAGPTDLPLRFSSTTSTTCATHGSSTPSRSTPTARVCVGPKSIARPAYTTSAVSPIAPISSSRCVPRRRHSSLSRRLTPNTPTTSMATRPTRIATCIICRTPLAGASGGGRVTFFS